MNRILQANITQRRGGPNPLVLWVLPLCLAGGTALLKAQAPAPIAPTSQFELAPATLLTPGADAGSLAVALAGATHKAAIVVLPQPQQYQTALKTISGGGDLATAAVRWGDLQGALRKVGAMPVALNPNVLAVLQGDSYRYATRKVPSYCFGAHWHLLWDGYQKLPAKRQAELLSTEGLVARGDLADLPPELKELSETVKAGLSPQPNAAQVRTRISLKPMLYTSLFDTPTHKVLDGWSWDGETWTGDNIPFPQSINFQPRQGPDWYAKTLNLGHGLVAPALLIAELERVSGFQVQVDAKLKWPSIGVAGDGVTADAILQSLKAAHLMEVHTQDAPKVLTLAASPKLRAAFGTPSITQEAYPHFVDLFEKLAQREGDNFGPLPYSTLQLPLSALPTQWLVTVLGNAEAPPEAYADAGVDLKGGLNYQKAQTAVAKWQQLYTDASLVSIPALEVDLTYESKNDPQVPGQPAWTPSHMIMSTPITMFCQD